jgi:hypothetical protein
MTEVVYNLRLDNAMQFHCVAVYASVPSSVAAGDRRAFLPRDCKLQVFLGDIFSSHHLENRLFARSAVGSKVPPRRSEER